MPVRELTCPRINRVKLRGKQLFLFHRFHSDLLHKTLHAISQHKPHKPNGCAPPRRCQKTLSPQGRRTQQQPHSHRRRACPRRQAKPPAPVPPLRQALLQPVRRRLDAPFKPPGQFLYLPSNSCSVMQPCLLFSIYIPTKRMYNPKIKLPAGNPIFPATHPESDRRSRPPGHECCHPSAERPSSPASRRGKETCASSARGRPDRQTAAARGW